MNKSDEKKTSLFDRMIYVVIIVVVAAGIAIPWALKAADSYLGWTPPPAVKRMLDWLPPYE